ncbi:MAG: hypothetical protein ABSF86_21835, partial [Steroidobacteraceae bacterium]
SGSWIGNWMIERCTVRRGRWYQESEFDNAAHYVFLGSQRGRHNAQIRHDESWLYLYDASELGDL